MAKLRVDQLGAEVVGTWKPSASDHLRVDQLGAEVVGAWNGHKLRVDQLGVEFVGFYGPFANARVNQLGVEAVGTLQLPGPDRPSNLRVNQLGVEIVRTLQLPPPAGDTTGFQYYIGPGFVADYVPKKQPVGYEPQWGAMQLLTALGSIVGIDVTITAGTINNVSIVNGTPKQVVFPTPFNEACYFVAATYIPQNGDSANIVVYGNPFPASTQPTAEGFELTGLIVSGTSTNTTGTFVYVAVGL